MVPSSMGAVSLCTKTVIHGSTSQMVISNGIPLDLKFQPSFNCCHTKLILHDEQDMAESLVGPHDNSHCIDTPVFCICTDLCLHFIDVNVDVFHVFCVYFRVYLSECVLCICECILC